MISNDGRVSPEKTQEMLDQNNEALRFMRQNLSAGKENSIDPLDHLGHIWRLLCEQGKKNAELDTHSLPVQCTA